MNEENNWYILGKGLDLESQEIEFSPNLKLRKITDNLSVFDLAAAGAVGFREWAVLEPISSYCNFEIVSLKKNVKGGYDTLNRAWLLNTLLILRRKLKVNSIAFSSYSWNEIAGFQKRSVGNNVKLEPFVGNLLDYHTKMIHLPRIESFSLLRDDIEWITNNYENANTLAGENDNFRFALEAVNSWRYSKDLRSAIAILWAAIESIVGVSSEIVFRLSLNISSILENRGERRFERFNQIKQLYGLRSKVVHGVELTQNQISSTIEQSYILLCDLLSYMIVKNKILSKVDFEKAVFY
jgi:hypothetical protein